MERKRDFFKRSNPEEVSRSTAYRRFPKATKFDFRLPNVTEPLRATFVHSDSIEKHLALPYVSDSDDDHDNQSQLRYNSCSSEILDDITESLSLYYGCPHTMNEALKDVLEIFHCHNASNILQDDILRFLDKYLPPAHSMPSSLYTLNQHLASVQTSLISNWHCTVHQEYLGKGSEKKECLDCAESETSGETRFHSLDVRESLTQLLGDPVIQRLLKKPIPPGFLDIKHANRYAKSHQSHTSNHATLLFWYDGTDLKGKGNYLWILMWMLLELPIECRWDMARYAVICCANSKPSAQVILAPFVQDILQLQMTPLKITPDDPSNPGIVYETRINCCVCDAPARCDGRGNRQWNARDFGCTTCLTPAVPGSGSQVYPYHHGQQHQRRTHGQTLTDAVEWATKRAAATTQAQLTASAVGERGVNNYSELLRLPETSFDIIRCFPHEILHILLNLGKQFFSLLRNINVHDLPFSRLQPIFCAGRTTLLDDNEARLLGKAMEKITFPSSYTRIPGSNPDDWATYKASEYMFFYLVIVPFLFQKRNDEIDVVIHGDIRRLLLTFSYALHYLLCDKFEPSQNPADVIESRAVIAQRMIDDFVHTSTVYFGKNKITFAFHQLQHLPENYRDFGPAYAWSAFGWESIIGVCKKMQHGTNKQQQEMSNKIARDQNVRTYLSKSRNINAIKMLGASLPAGAMSQSERTALRLALEKDHVPEPYVIDVYKRLSFRNGLKAESRDNERTSRHSDSTYRLETGQIISLSKFAHIRVLGTEYFYAIGNLLSGTNTRSHIPVLWKETSLLGSQPVVLDIPHQYRSFPLPSSCLVAAVPCHLLDVPMFVMTGPQDCLTQFISPSLTVMPKN